MVEASTSRTVDPAVHDDQPRVVEIAQPQDEARVDDEGAPSGGVFHTAAEDGAEIEIFELVVEVGFSAFGPLRDRSDAP